MKKIIVIISAFTIITGIRAQVRDDNAFAGKTAVFIYHGLPPASPASPDTSGNTGYIVQRKEKGGAWATIQQTHFPESASELYDRYQLAKYLMPDAGIGFDAPDAWMRWKKYRSFDSLKNAIAYPPGQMAFGILLADTTVQKGKVYRYRVLKLNSPVPQGDELSSNEVAFPAKVNVPRPRFLRRQTEPDAIRLQWAIRGTNHVPGFAVFRQDGSKRAFEPVKVTTSYLKRNDSIIYMVIDDRIMESEAYRYYITPVNSFGGGGNIISDTIAATSMNVTQLLTPQFIRTAEDQKNRAIHIGYLLADAGYIGSVHLLRSVNYDTGYTEVSVNSGTDTSFTDYKIVPGQKYYYYLLMTDKMGRNGTRSIKTVGLFQDTANAFPARFVTAKSFGKNIQVKWQVPPDIESLSGFYVCRNDGKGFQRITALIPYNGIDTCTYIDTSSLLQNGTQYAYTVLTENLSNRVSRASNIAYASPAYTSPAGNGLVSPREVKAMADAKSIRILWYDMRFVNNNQAYYNVYRKTADDKDYKLISARYSGSANAYIDSTIAPGISYTYALESADAAGNVSGRTTTAPVSIQMKSPVVPQITGYSSAAGASIALSGSAAANKSVYSVYRYTRGQKPVKIGTVKSGETSFTDAVNAAGMYYYFIALEPEPFINKSNTVIISR